MALLLGKVSEQDALIRVLNDGFTLKASEIISTIRGATKLTTVLKNITNQHSILKILIDRLGVWFPVEYYRKLPVIYPYVVRDPTCRQNKVGRSEEYCSPNDYGYMRADNTPIKQLVEGHDVRSPLEWYCGQMRRGFVASHAWRQPRDYKQDRVLASRNPWLNTFVPNLCWLPASLSRLTDEEGSFAQRYLQKVAIETYREIKFNNVNLQSFVDRLWDILPDPELNECRDSVPPIKERAQLQMQKGDVEKRLNDLQTVILGLHDAQISSKPSRKILHKRYTLDRLREKTKKNPDVLCTLYNNLTGYYKLLSGSEVGMAEPRVTFPHVGDNTEKKRSPMRPVESETQGNEILGKAIKRLSKWARNSECMPYRIIRAFLKLGNVSGDINSIRSLNKIRRLCSNKALHPDMYVEKFRGCWASLKTDQGNSYGRMFVQNGDDVSLPPEVALALKPLVGEFLT